MSKKELLERRIRSMARSMEVEGADYERAKKIMMDELRSRKKK